MARRVLVTGATGYIASLMLPAFRERYELTLLDVRDHDGEGHRVGGVTVIDLLAADPSSYRSFFRGVQTVVHLGHRWGTRRDTRDVSRQAYLVERSNVDMAYNVYEAALEEGVERVVVASSNHAADWYETLLRTNRLELLEPSDRPLSNNWYGWAKEAYEHAGFVFASGALGRKLQVVQLRIGAPREIDVSHFKNDPVGYKRDLGAYISARDLQQLFCGSIESPNIDNEHGIPFHVFYGISNNARAFWSIANARRVIGYAPEDDSEVRFARDIAGFIAKAPGLPGKLAE